MKATELIKKLEEITSKNPDIDVEICDKGILGVGIDLVEEHDYHGTKFIRIEIDSDYRIMQMEYGYYGGD